MEHWEPDMIPFLARQRKPFPTSSILSLAAAVALALACFARPAFAATITVTGTGDTVALDGVVTLREAIMSINAGASVNADVVPVGAYGTADTINFNISGAGVQTIAPSTFLPNISKPAFIDGYSQPGASVNTNGPGLGTNAVLLIELDLANSHALTLTGGNGTVRGLVINRSHLAAGISLSGNSGYVIAGNFIGTNPAGNAAGPGNDGDGIDISATNTTIGGLNDADRNLISGNVGSGILCCGAGVTNDDIQNNLIGTNAAGTAALGNQAQGISMSSGTGSLIGSTNPAGRNIISASGQHGISMNANGNTVQGNYIGTNVTGTAAIPNAVDGINLGGGNNVVGGTAAGAGNLISGNTTTGITLSNQAVAGNVVQGNLIGTDHTGTVAIAGQAGSGVNVGPFVNGNSIGGSVAGAGNVIAFNSGNGILVSGGGPTGGTANGILGNRIFSNGKLGIKLGTNTSDTVPTPNDTGDADTGPNTLQNYPILSTAVISGANIAISGALNSTPGAAFRIELFSSVSCDPSGNGQGQTFLGFVNVTTDGGGNITFGPSTLSYPGGQRQITATATNSANNTSEFSPCILASGPPTLQGASSRKVHGGAGTFSLPLAP
jgi:hypothetical protein